MDKRTKKILKELEKSRKVFWNISANTGLFLNLFIKHKKYKTILEIGSSNAYSGIWIADAIKKNKGKLYSIESNKKDRYPAAVKNIKKAGLSSQVKLILGHAPEDIPQEPKIFDMACKNSFTYGLRIT